MSRRRRLIHLRTFLFVGFISVLFVSVGYALFSQNLSLQGKGTAVVSPSPGGLTVVWTRNAWQSKRNWSYNMNGTITNNGTAASSDWEITIQLPVSITGLSCWGGDCVLSGTTLTISSLSYNGAISPGGSTTLGVSFTSSSGSISFDNSVIATDPSATAQFEVITGLTATMAFQNQWQSGSNYVKQYNVTVTNTSGQKVKSWRIEISNWSNTTHSVAGLWNAGYVSETSRLLMTSQGALDNGASASFGGQLSVPSSAWTPDYVVKGRL